DDEHVGMTWRGDEMQPEPLQIVERVAKRLEFEFAAIARSGVHHADRQAAAEPVTLSAREGRDKFVACLCPGLGRAFGQGLSHQAFEKKPSHRVPLLRDRARNTSS